MTVLLTTTVQGKTKFCFLGFMGAELGCFSSSDTKGGAIKTTCKVRGLKPQRWFSTDPEWRIRDIKANNASYKSICPKEWKAWIDKRKAAKAARRKALKNKPVEVMGPKLPPELAPK